MTNLLKVSSNFSLNTRVWLVATASDSAAPESCCLYYIVCCSVAFISLSCIPSSCLVCLVVFLSPCRGGGGSGMRGVWTSPFGRSQAERLKLSTGKAGTKHVGARRPGELFSWCGGKREAEGKSSRSLESVLIGMCPLQKEKKSVGLLHKELGGVPKRVMPTARGKERDRCTARAIRGAGQSLSEQDGSETLFSPMTSYSKRSDPLASR